MPWHDLQACVTGTAARDVSAHFVERWNHHRSAKGTSDKHTLVDVTDNTVSCHTQHTTHNTQHEYNYIS